MKHKEAYDRWFATKVFPIEAKHDVKYWSKFAWQACEEFYESRRCDGCKHYGTEAEACNDCIRVATDMWEPKNE